MSAIAAVPLVWLAVSAAVLLFVAARREPFMTRRRYNTALAVFMVVVLGHWIEHAFQAIQVFVLGWDRPDARGALGMIWPSLVQSEALHYGYAVAMLIGIALLRPAFTSAARTWWDLALVLQIWHHLEHLLLLSQAIAGRPFFGAAQYTSFVQLVFPRIELHLFYNGVVFVPMLVAIYLQHFAPGRAPARAQATAP